MRLKFHGTGPTIGTHAATFKTVRKADGSDRLVWLFEVDGAAAVGYSTSKSDEQQTTSFAADVVHALRGTRPAHDEVVDFDELLDRPCVVVLAHNDQNQTGAPVVVAVSAAAA